MSSSALSLDGTVDVKAPSFKRAYNETSISHGSYLTTFSLPGFSTESDVP